jgi:hypothetical protein
MVRTLEAAAAWVDEVGLALLFPKADIVLPSLWEQVSGLQVTDWDTEEMNFFWWAKDELPARGLTCVGKHLARHVACIAPRLLPTLVAANSEEPEDEDPVVEAIRSGGPMTGPELREATGLTKKEVDRSIASLHHHLVLTNSHLVHEGSTWGTLSHDLLTRKWKPPKRLPAREDARLQLATIVLQHAGELTAADLAGALGWRRKEAATILDEIATGHDDPGGFRIWVQR